MLLRGGWGYAWIPNGMGSVDRQNLMKTALHSFQFFGLCFMMGKMKYRKSAFFGPLKQNRKSIGHEGRVTVLGVICPFLYATFRPKRVNNEKMSPLFAHPTVRTDPYTGKNLPI